MFVKDTGNKIARCLLMLAAMGAPSLLAQQSSVPVQAKAPDAAPPLQFDVVSVKEYVNKGESLFTSWRWDQSGLTAMNQTLTSLICLAYGVNFYQVSAGPDWMNTAYFQVQAKMDDATSAKLQQLVPEQREAMRKRMLQAVLADRFKLDVRIESKPFPGYRLVIAKGGSKLHEAAPDDTYANGAKGIDGAPLGRGLMMVNWENGGFVLRGQALSLEAFKGQLMGQVHAQVKDETGLKGVYDITLRFGQDRGLSADVDSTKDTSVPNALPSLFDALQEQLGLKLESRKEPDEAVIVEHVEKPTEN